MWYVVIVNDMFQLSKKEYETFYFQMWIALDASTKPFVKGLAKVKKVGTKMYSTTSKEDIKKMTVVELQAWLSYHNVPMPRMVSF
jgi:hypothetical protein